MLETVEAFCKKDDSAERAAFEAAMINKIENEGYKMSDLLYELFRCQKDIALLKEQMIEIRTKKIESKKGR